MCARNGGRKRHYKAGLTESFCWSEHQGTDLYLRPGRAVITSKEKLIVNQLLISTSVLAGCLMAGLSYTCRWHCFSHFTFSLIYIVLCLKQAASLYSDRDGFPLFTPSPSYSAQSSRFATNRLLNHLHFSDIQRTASSSVARTWAAAERAELSPSWNDTQSSSG